MSTSLESMVIEIKSGTITLSYGGESRHSGIRMQHATREIEMLAFCHVFVFSLPISL